MWYFKLTKFTTSFHDSLLVFSHLKEGQHFSYLKRQEGRKAESHVLSAFKTKINYICLKLFMRDQLPKTNISQTIDILRLTCERYLAVLFY